ncbi:MAG: methylamine dehydrogenase light chain [Candidatus Binataceae bacterium]
MMDGLFERLTRGVAQRTSRRSFLANLGRIAIGGVALPLLPIDRVTGKAHAQYHEGHMENESGNDTTCDYWRYCAFDGFLCTCCGGTITQCPAGTVASPTAWVGTCKHPNEKRDYIIAYRDCCGQAECGRCNCDNNKGEMPIYRTQLNNDTVWCFGSKEMAYHCTTAVVLGEKS